MSNPIVETYLAEQMAILATSEPYMVTGELGFGSDLSCVYDLTPTMEMVGGNSVEIIQQSLLRRLITPRGSLYDDLDYGLGVSLYLNSSMTVQQRQEIAGVIQGEMMKDDRLESCSVELTESSQYVAEVVVSCVAIDPNLGEFALTFGLTETTVVEI